jgi:hypothetical protein
MNARRKGQCIENPATGRYDLHRERKSHKIQSTGSARQTGRPENKSADRPAENRNLGMSTN